MNQETLNKLATQFDELATVLTAISGTFRGGEGDTADTDGDAAPVKPVRGRTPRKPAAAAPAANPKAEAPDVTEDDVRTALKELAATKGKDKMAEALAEVGAGRLPDVTEDEYPALMAAIKTLMDDEDEAPAKKATPAKKAPAKKAAPTYDEVEEKFRELVAADKAAAKAVLNEAGLKRLSDVDQEDDGALTDLLAAIVAATEDDDGLV